MANYKEIVTKAIIGKGKKTFTSTNSVIVTNSPSTILGCWVINHNFSGSEVNNQVVINGSYDVNIWYSYDNDTKTDVIKETNTYKEVVNIKKNNDSEEANDIIVRSLKQPSCVKVDIDDKKIIYTVEKELGIELVGDVKVKIEASEEEDPWDEILDSNPEEVAEVIDNEVKEEFIDEKEII